MGRVLEWIEPVVDPFIPVLRVGVRWGGLIWVRQACLAMLFPFIRLHRERKFVSKSRFGFRLSGSTHDVVGGCFYLFGVWEPSATNWICRRLTDADSGRTFVDVGANIGYYSLLASSLLPKGRVVSIEASPSNYSILKHNVELNSSSNIRLVHEAVANKSGMVTIYKGHPWNQGLSHTIDLTSVASEFGWQPMPEAEVPARQLMEMLAPEELSTTRLVKVDIEGAELQLAGSLKEWLRSSSEDIEFIIEIHPSLHKRLGNNVGDFLRIFKDAGFRMYNIRNTYSVHDLLRNNVLPPEPISEEAILNSKEELDLVFSRLNDVVVN